MAQPVQNSRQPTEPLRSSSSKLQFLLSPNAREPSRSSSSEPQFLLSPNARIEGSSGSAKPGSNGSESGHSSTELSANNTKQFSWAPSGKFDLPQPTFAPNSLGLMWTDRWRVCEIGSLSHSPTQVRFDITGIRVDYMVDHMYQLNVCLLSHAYSKSRDLASGDRDC